MKNIKKLTLLHSNDMHGDFLAEEVDEKLVGGVSMLSGYINQVRREEKNVIYSRRSEQADSISQNAYLNINSTKNNLK